MTLTLPQTERFELVELDVGYQEAIPCQCLHIEDYLSHALHFVYRVPFLRRVFNQPQRKRIPFQPGEPLNDVYPECPRQAAYRATFKGRHPELGMLIPSSFTLCQSCMKHWQKSVNCSAYESL